VNKNKNEDENKSQTSHFICITKSIKNSKNELTASKSVSLHHFERKQQQSKHYEDSLMILFCVVRLIVKITLKWDINKLKNELKSVIYKKAVITSDADQWKAAINVKIKTLNKNKMWDFVNLFLNCYVLQKWWIYYYKHDENNLIMKHKVRWVIKEFKQHYNVNYSEMYIFIVKLIIYKVTFTIVTYYNYYLKQMNIKTVFLNKVLNKKVFITQFTDYINRTKVCQLNKTLYRLKQSLQIWY